MNENTRFIFNTYMKAVAELNGTPDASKSFAVVPNADQKLWEGIKEDSSFLAAINILPVLNKSGEVFGISSGLIASTTDTNQRDREASDPTSFDKENNYDCKQLNFDSAVKYDTLDQWAHMKNVESRLKEVIVESTALSLICIGFNGIKWTKTSNKTTYPLLQDVQRGWLQRMREENSERVMGSDTVNGVTTAEPIEVGASASDFKNLDAVVLDAKSQLHPVYRKRKDLVVIVSDNLLDDKYFSLTNAAGEKSTELVAANLLSSDKKLGGLPPVTVPFFPDNTIMVTTLKNLSIYTQTGTHRRKIVDNDKRDQIENIESQNLDYVVESYACAVLVENIKRVA